jgi:hypothetical protein
LQTRTRAMEITNRPKLMATLAIATTIATSTMRAATEATGAIGNSLP